MASTSAAYAPWAVPPLAARKAGAYEAASSSDTVAYPNGEIRGFVVAAPIPEPAEWAMLGAGLAGLVWLGRRRRDEEDMRLAV
ncbi:MAG: PEP-CTERM sorting domain-containing protein [Acetobacteraceae bacterium]|nr:MAG: PEP-CTERM sorting domain-containing protein [Acetobacteraceae bacterium]